MKYLLQYTGQQIDALLDKVNSGSVIESVEKTEDGYDVTLTDGTVFSLKNGDKGEQGEQGIQGPQGEKGEKGDNGDNGVGIEDITQTVTSTEDKGVNVVTVTKTNGESQSFEVRNGSKGSDGDMGFSPIVNITEIDGGHRVTITDATSAKSFDVMDGKDSDSLVFDTTMSDSSENAVQNKVIKAYVDDAVATIDIAVDSALSTTSTNPVQNKVVTSGINVKYTKPSSGIPLSDLASAVQTSLGKADTALQAVPSEYVTESELTAKGYATTSALAGKVDKVTGKQLTTEDFTTALKTKLEGLNNYDDSAIQEAVEGLQSQLNTLVSGDVDTAIESFNEIIAFLEGVADTETLEGIMASIEQQIAAKYTKPSSGIPKSDLASAVQTSLGKADTALQSHQSLDGYVKDTDLASVATSGSYNDLSNKPTIPDALADLSADASHRTVTDTEKATWNAKSDFSGSYADLTDKPTIPSAVTVDSALSSSSTNPVQNKVINSALAGKQATISDLATIRSGAGAGATAVQPSDLATVATSGSYADLSNKPTIPSAVTESTVSGWGFTKNAGTITGITMNGASKGTSGVVNLGTVITAHQDISGKQDKLVSGTNIKTINGTSLLGSGNVAISPAYSKVSHGTSDTTFALTPNVFHVWDSVASLTLTLGTETSGVANEYLFQFTSGDTATSLSLPSSLLWSAEPTIDANKTYQVSILNNCATLLAFE